MEHYGSAYIDVNADSRNFERQLKKQIGDAVKDVKIVLNPVIDDKGLQGQINRLARELSGAEVKFKASLDTKGLDRTVSVTKKKMEDLSKDVKVAVNPELNSKGLQGQVNRLARELSGAEISFNAKLNTGDLDRSVSDTKKKLEDISKKPINVNSRVTTTTTNQIKNDIQDAVQESAPSITVKVDGDLGPLRDKLTKFREEQSDNKLELELELDLSDTVADSRMEDFLTRWDSETFGVNVDLEGVEEAYDHLEHLQSKFEDLNTEVTASSEATAEASASSITSQISQLLSGGGGGGGGGTGPFVIPITPKLSFNPFARALKDRQTRDAIKGFTTALAGVVPMDQIKDSFLNIMADLEGTALRFATQITKASAAAAGIVGAIGGAVRLVSDLGQALQVVAAAPAILAAGVAGMQAMKIAWSGFGGALDMDPEKAAEALAELTPKARESAVEMRKLKVAIVEATQEAYWDAMGDAIVKASKALQGPMVKGMEGTATSMAEMTVAMTDQITAFAKSGGLTTTFNNINTAISNASEGVGSITEALLTLTRVGSERLPRLGEWITELGNAFNDFISRAEDSGAILGWIDNGVRRLQQLGSIIGSVASIFDEINQSARAAGYLGLTAVTDALELAANAMNHPNFRSGLFTMLDSARIAWEGFGTGVGHMFAGLATQVDNLGQMMISSGEIGEVLGRNLESMFAKSSLFDGLSTMMQDVRRGVDYLEPGFVSLGNALGDFAIIAGTIFREMAPGINTVATMMESVIGNMVPAFQILTPVLNDAVHILTRMLIPIVDGASRAFSDFLQMLSNIPTPILAAGILIGGLATKVGLLVTAVGKIKTLGLASAITSAFGGSAGGAMVGDLLGGLTTNVGTAMRGTKDLIVTGLQSAMAAGRIVVDKGGRAVAGAMLTAVTMQSQHIPSRITNSFDFSGAVQKAKTAASAIGSALAGIARAFAPLAIIGAITSVFMSLQDYSQKTNEIAQGMRSSFSISAEGIATDATKMSESVGQALGRMSDEGWTTQMKMGWDTLKSALIDDAESLKTFFEHPKSAVERATDSMGTSVQSFSNLLITEFENGSITAGRSLNHINVEAKKAFGETGEMFIDSMDAIDFYDKLAPQFEAAGLDMKKLRDMALNDPEAFKYYVLSIGEIGGAFEAGRPKAEDFKEALSGLADAKLPEEFWTALEFNPSSDLIEGLSEISTMSKTLASNYETLGNSSTTLDQKMGALRSNMEVLGVKTLGNVKGAYEYNMAQQQMKEKTDELAAALKNVDGGAANFRNQLVSTNKVNGETIKSLNVSTEAGQRMYEVLSQQSELIEGNYMSRYQTVLAQTGDSQAALSEAVKVANVDFEKFDELLKGMGVPEGLRKELMEFAGMTEEAVKLSLEVENYESSIQKLVAVELMAKAVSNGDYEIILSALGDEFYSTIREVEGITSKLTGEKVEQYFSLDYVDEGMKDRILNDLIRLNDPSLEPHIKAELINNAEGPLKDMLNWIESSTGKSFTAELDANAGKANEAIQKMQTNLNDIRDNDIRLALEDGGAAVKLSKINEESGKTEGIKRIRMDSGDLDKTLEKYNSINGYTFSDAELAVILQDDNARNALTAFQAFELTDKYSDINVNDYGSAIVESLQMQQLSPKMLEILGDDADAINTFERLLFTDLSTIMEIDAGGNAEETLKVLEEETQRLYQQATQPLSIRTEGNAKEEIKAINDQAIELFQKGSLPLGINIGGNAKTILPEISKEAELLGTAPLFSQGLGVTLQDNATPKLENIDFKFEEVQASSMVPLNLNGTDNVSPLLTGIMGGAAVISGLSVFSGGLTAKADDQVTPAVEGMKGITAEGATFPVEFNLGQLEHLRGVLRHYQNTTITVSTSVNMGGVEHLRGVLRHYQNTTVTVSTNVNMGGVEHLRGVLRHYQNTNITVNTSVNMGGVEHLRGVLRHYQNTNITVNTSVNMGNVEHLRGVLRHYQNTTITVNTVVNSSAITTLQAQIASMRSRTLTITVTARDSASAVVNRLRGIRIPNKAVVLTARDTASAVVNRIRGARLPNKTVVVTARDSASASLNRIRGIQIPAKTVRVIVNDSASAGLNRVRALQIPVKTARVMINDRATAVLNKIRAFNIPTKTFSIIARDLASSVIRRINAMRVHNKSNTITTYHRNVQRNALGGINNARGVRAFANGGFENHVAQIARGGWPYRVWAEPETGGEAYIPLAKSKRHRSEQILMQVAKMFGMTLSRSTSGIAKSISSAQGSVQKFANGGFSGVKSMSFATGGIIRENRVLTNRVNSLSRQSKSLQTRINNANKLVKTYEARQKAFQKAKNTRMANRYKARAAAQKKSADRLKKQQDAINKRRDQERQKLNELRNAQKSWDNSKNNSIRYFRDIGEGVSSGLDSMRKSIRSEYRGFLDMARDAPDKTRASAALQASRTVNAQSKLTNAIWRNGDEAGLRHSMYRITNRYSSGRIPMTLADISKAYEKQNEIFQNATRAMQQIQEKLSSEFSVAESFSFAREQNLPNTGRAMLGSAQQTRKNLIEFSGLLNQLQKKGFNGSIIGEIASMGSVDGIQVSRELLKMNKPDMAALNKAYLDIQKQSESIGNRVGAGMFNTGTELINGTVRGMEANLNKIEKAAMKIATTVEQTVKKQLKIKSPSRVFRDEVGAMIGAGMVEGLVGSEESVSIAAGRLASAAYIDPVVESSGSRSGLGSSRVGGNHTAYNVNYNVYNPVAEKASDAAKKTRTTLKHLGDI